jgi:hypothetical protein
MKPSESDPLLTSALRDWEISPRRNPGFRAAVWTRIGASPAARSWRGYFRTHAGWISGALALALVLGAWTGSRQAKARESAERVAMARRYVQALDARTMQMP